LGAASTRAAGNACREGEKETDKGREKERENVRERLIYEGE
jgi:hypothetical protein